MLIKQLFIDAILIAYRDMLHMWERKGFIGKIKNDFIRYVFEFLLRIFTYIWNIF
jgi:hypothetical protein